MKKILVSFIAMICAVSSAFAQNSYVPSPENLKAREQFSKNRFGIFIHWGIYSMMGRGEWVLQTDGLTHDEYRRLAAGFNPSKFDAAQWARIFKSAGAKYICITSRHHDGFSMFGTKASDYNVVDATPFGRDVLKELSQACAAEGLTFNVYYSLVDWGRNDYWPQGRTGNKTGRPEGREGDWEHYHDFMDQQLTELLTGYGPVGAIWFDGVWDFDFLPVEEMPQKWQYKRHYDLIHNLQPGCLVGNNHHLDVYPGEDIQIFERDIPGYNEAGYSGQEISRLPLETCQTINGSWGYRMSDLGYGSADDLVQYLARTAGKGANLLLNVGPRPDGTIPEEAVDRLEKMGQWLGEFGESIYETEGGYISEQSWGVTTQKGNTLFMHVLKYQDSIEIELPEGNRIVSATTFDGTSKVVFKQTKGKAVISVPAGFDGPDQILRINFKKAL